MLLLHTSDWHLGRSLHRVDLRAAQAAFLDHLVDVVRREKVDAVLVAGDVYDRAIPPVEAVALCEQALLRLRDAGARVIVTSGNHDSARRLGFGRALFDVAGVHIRTSAAEVASPVLLDDTWGTVGVYPLPYLEPDAVRAELPEVAGAQRAQGLPVAGARSHSAVLGHALAAVRADRSTRRLSRSVVLAHAWVAGGESTESERDIAVGGVGHVPLSLFAGVDYAALGHLHGPQVLGEGLRYSGSPLPYSFSEARHTKGSWLVELDERGLVRVEKVEAPVHRRLSLVTGTVDDLLTSSAHDGVEQHFLSAVVTDTARPEEPMARLRRRFPHLLTLDWQPSGSADDGRSYRARVRGQSDEQIADGFVAHVRNAPPGPAEAALLRSALEAGRAGQAVA